MVWINVTHPGFSARDEKPNDGDQWVPWEQIRDSFCPCTKAEPDEPGAMGVDFNGLRKSACNAFDDVVEAAKKCREENGNDSTFDDLADALDELRMFVAGVALCYDDRGSKDVLGDRTLLSMHEDED